MTINCGFCGDEITGEFAKYDSENDVYLHDGKSLGEMDGDLKARGLDSGIVGASFAASGKPLEEEREYQNQLSGNERFCAQSYKAERVVQGKIVILNKVSLEEVTSN